jgi:hypothetical protein
VFDRRCSLTGMIDIRHQSARQNINIISIRISIRISISISISTIMIIIVIKIKLLFDEVAAASRRGWQRANIKFINIIINIINNNINNNIAIVKKNYPGAGWR